MQGLAAEEHEGAGEDVDLVYAVGCEVGQAVGGETARVGEEAREAEELAEGDPRRGEAAFAFGQEGTVPIDHFHADGARVRVLLHEAAGAAEGVLAHDRVRVQQQDVLAAAGAQSLVVGGGEADVVGVCDEVHLGEAWL